MRRILFLVLLTAACSATDDGNPDAGATGGVDAPSGTPAHRALVELRLEPPLFDGEEPRMEIRGGFLLTSDPRCKKTTVGDCEVSDCPQALIGNDYADPGKLTFSPSNNVVSFTPGPSVLSFRANVVPWAAEETITLTSKGADVPALNIAVASPRTLDAGEGRSPSGPPIVRSQPFLASWRTIAEDVQVEMRQGRDTANGPFEVLVVCRAKGTSGIATVPPAALAKFIPKASGGLSVFVVAHALREKTVDAGDFAVTFRVLRSFDEEFFHEVQ